MPDRWEFLDTRAFTYLKMQQLLQALADYDAALKIAPGAVSALFGRGVVRRRMGDVKGGDADIADAIARCRGGRAAGAPRRRSVSGRRKFIGGPR